MGRSRTINITKDAAGRDPREVVTGFLDDLVQALRAEKVTVRALTARGSTDDGEHSWDKTTGYRCTFRGIAVVLKDNPGEVLLDGTVLGEDILLSQMPGTHVSRYALLKGDMSERYIMQEAGREAQKRTDAEADRKAKKGAADAAAYAGLADKIRAARPRVIGCGRKRRSARTKKR